MSRPTKIEREHYAKLRYCVIVDVLWDKPDGQPLPVLVLSTPGGGTAECTILSDPEGNSPGHLEHNL